MTLPHVSTATRSIERLRRLPLDDPTQAVCDPCMQDSTAVRDRAGGKGQEGGMLSGLPGHQALPWVLL